MSVISDQIEVAKEIEYGARTDQGCIRANNEDSFGVAAELNLFVLSDGMGGLALGEVASRLAVETVLKHCREANANPSLPFAGKRMPGISGASNRLASAIRLANQAVHEEARKNGDALMGATIVAVRFSGERMSLAHVGDSRAYRLRHDRLEQLTQDHSFVAEQLRQGNMSAAEAVKSPLQNVLVRAIGVQAEVEVDVTEELVMEGDTVLLCSDGLTRELSDAQIAGVLAECDDGQEATEALIDLAKQAGGGDNITAIVLRNTQKAGGVFARVGKWFRGSA
jgi:PPM family protein phosphatase